MTELEDALRLQWLNVAGNPLDANTVDWLEKSFSNQILNQE